MYGGYMIDDIMIAGNTFDPLTGILQCRSTSTVIFLLYYIREFSDFVSFFSLSEYLLSYGHFWYSKIIFWSGGG